MKIKELHLRNIASIEAADIDFSQGLTDGVTGDQASIFLIAGDTGAGKSVILDGISLALFKTTPRIAGVVNSKENEFKNAAGETIRLVDVEQYTRLGITPGDPCYSEVVFDGNDGKEYRAKLALGLYYGKGSVGADGPRPVKHSKPVWTVTCEGEIYDKKDTASVIQQAIGLDVKQFCRMAMLAQGQFATFLVGEKKERADVLQELTDTEQFLRYGKAVTNLFGKAKKECEIAESVYNEVQGRPHSEEELESLGMEHRQVEKEKQELGDGMEKVHVRLGLVRAIATANGELEEAEKEKKRLDELVSGEDYQHADAVVKAWDGTSEQRKLLADKRLAEDGLKLAEEERGRLSVAFSALCGDLAFRKEQAADLKEALEAEKVWLEERKERDSLYRKAGEWILRMENYGKTLEKETKTAADLLEEKEKTAGLEMVLEEKKSLEQKARESVEAKQKEIDALKTQLQELDPEGTRRAAREASARHQGLDSLQQVLDARTRNEKDRDDRKAEIEADERRLELLETDAKQKGTLFRKDKEAYEALLKCQRTMNEGREGALVRIREELVAEGETVCPLCGQRIETLATGVGDLLGERLDELGNLTEEARQRQAAAEKEWNAAEGARQRFSGALEGKRGELGRLEKALEQEKPELERRALELGLDVSAGLVGQIQPALDDLGVREEELEALLLKARTIQEDLIRLQEEKDPLDLKLAETGRDVLKAQTDLGGNAKAIERMESDCRKLKEEKEALSVAIGQAVGPFYPDWESHVERTKNSLAEDAGEYVRRSESLHTGSVRHEKAMSTIQSVSGSMETVLRIFPDWDGAFIPKEHPSEDIVFEWNDLSSQAGNLKGQMDTHRRKMKECEGKLRTWYSESGRDEAWLDIIIGWAPEVEGCRAFLSGTKDRILRNDTLAKSASERKSDAMGKLEVSSEEDLPKEQDLQNKWDELSGLQDKAVSRLTEIEIRQKTIEDNIKAIAEKESVYAKAVETLDKWTRLNAYFGGERFRTRVQTFILRPLLNNANLYLKQITDRYELTCSEENQQLSILVLDKYNKREVRSATLLSGGERFMVSLALSLALSSLTRPGVNVDILFIDEGFGTLDGNSLESVMQTLERVQEIAGVKGRRIGIISHRPELEERIPVQIRVEKKGEGRSKVRIQTEFPD